jgi:hypothetical protein
MLAQLKSTLERNNSELETLQDKHQKQKQRHKNVKKQIEETKLWALDIVLGYVLKTENFKKKKRLEHRDKIHKKYSKKYNDDISDLEQKSNDEVKMYLKESDTEFNELVSKEELLRAILIRSNNLLTIIENTIEKIDDASDLELFDAVWNNAGLTILSYAETKEASEEILDTQWKVDDYEGFINWLWYTTNFHRFLPKEKIDWFLWWIWILSIFVMEKLEEIDDNIKITKSEIEEFIKLIKGELKGVEQKISDRIKKEIPSIMW